MQRKIDNLIAKKLSGNASGRDIHELSEWREMNEANEAYYQEAKKMWLVAGSLDAEVEDETEMAWQEFKMMAPEESQIKPAKTTSPVFYLRAAAVLIFVITSLYLMRLVLFPDNTPELALSTAVINYTDTFESARITSPAPADTMAESPVEAPEKRHLPKRKYKVAMIAVSSEDSAMVFTLPDNTRVYLNTNSKLVYPETFVAARHTVYLSGEAYFEMSSGGTDLYVDCHNTRSRALGSAFNIKGMRDGVVEISAISGTLEIGKIDDPSYPLISLKKGEQVVYNTANHDIKKSHLSRKDKWWKFAGFRQMVKQFFNRILHPQHSAEKQ